MKKINQMTVVAATTILFAIISIGCTATPTANDVSETSPAIYPDYTDLTVPVNIAPLNFMISDAKRIIANYEGNNMSISVYGRNRIEIPQKKWKKLLQKNAGDTIFLEIIVKHSKKWIKYPKTRYFVSTDCIDPYIVYRKIPPGYDEWNQMGLFQRNLESFNEAAVITNASTKKNCMNCHTFCMNDPDAMVFHFRQKYSGTYIYKGNILSRIDTKTEHTISNCVYPYWHPSGQFIAFSTNLTSQSLHAHPDLNVEVYDTDSDIVIFDVEKNELFTDSLLNLPDIMETFPAFSPDGKKLFFSASVKPENLPQQYKSIKYSLCSIDFDPHTKKFGTTIDTLISSFAVNKSVSFAHPSPNGKYLLCTLSDYGCFPSWNEESDLYLFCLSSSQLLRLDAVNSPYSEGFTSWSSCNRWITFSSRRENRQYNNLYFSHIDSAGNLSKPFLMPQKKPVSNIMKLYAYNKPEFVKAKVTLKQPIIVNVAKGDVIPVSFSGKSNKKPEVIPSVAIDVN